MNVIARLEFEPIYFKAAVQHFSHYATETPTLYIEIDKITNALKVMPPIHFHKIYNRYKGEKKMHYWIEQVFSYKTVFLHVVPTISYAFLPAVNKNLYADLVGPLLQK